jgi:hypothetical protein
MKLVLPFFLLTALIASAGEGVYRYHEAFRFLLKETEKLTVLTSELKSVSDSGINRMEMITVLEAKAMSELLLVSIKHMLLQHTAQVDAFSKTRYYSDEQTIQAIEILVGVASSTIEKCEQISGYSARISLDEKIDSIEQIASEIVKRLGPLVPEKQDSTVAPDPKS